MTKVITFGVFDYFHLGHLRLFKQARAYGDYLIVAVQDEKNILEFKPEAKILYSTEERVEIIQALRTVDDVIIYDSLTPTTLEGLDFDVLALGEDHHGGRFDLAVDWCAKHGKTVVRLKRTPGICSSDIKNNL